MASKQLPPRAATMDDIPTLVSHRYRMFEEVAASRGVTSKTDGLGAFRKSYATYLQSHLADGTVSAWVVEDQGKLVASGVVSLLLWPPGLGEGLVGLVHSLFTVPEYRRLGIARRITETAIEFCRAGNAKWMLLGASEAGRPLYESLGFKPASTMMRLTLE